MNVIDYTMTGADVNFILDTIIGILIVILLFSIINIMITAYLNCKLEKIAKHLGIDDKQDENNDVIILDQTKLKD